MHSKVTGAHTGWQNAFAERHGGMLDSRGVAGQVAQERAVSVQKAWRARQHAERAVEQSEDREVRACLGLCGSRAHWGHRETRSLRLRKLELPQRGRFHSASRVAAAVDLPPPSRPTAPMRMHSRK